MSDMELVLDILQLGLGVAVLLVVLIKRGPSKRAGKRSEIAMMAVDYAEQMGGESAQKLAHAIGAAQRIDAADNGKRDFSDAELRIEIEATLARRAK